MGNMGSGWMGEGVRWRYVAIRITKNEEGDASCIQWVIIRDGRLQRLKCVEAGAAVSNLLINRFSSLAPFMSTSTPLPPFSLGSVMRFIPLQTSRMLFAWSLGHLFKCSLASLINFFRSS